MKIWVIAFAATIVLSARGWAATESLTITTEDTPPFNYLENGEVKGESTDRLKAALAAADIKYSIAVYPWVRAYRMALSEPNTCVYSTTLTPERQDLFKWVSPLNENTWMLIAPENSPITLSSLEQARPYRIGGYSNDSKSLFLQSQGFDVDSAPTDGTNIRKLEAGRIDLWMTGRAGLALAQKANFAHKVVLTVKSVTMGLACNISVSDETIAALNAALGKILASR